ncbi:putative mediator complex subunit 9 [Tieghemostelium lacteum]|uniref:Putative mediator complex subunit 9 n=1 Tax=Tieghemostelium lacteum TaxID=361077 RepID=A0A151Z6L0_TIELA|nr:putative mediator complex subunit 9 [Tieghemostelium lacteum]|eukprot:KYQ89575.1 putative mediator complex subunit 9 [Tieghemostelium lacteum]
MNSPTTSLPVNNAVTEQPSPNIDDILQEFQLFQMAVDIISRFKDEELDLSRAQSAYNDKTIKCFKILNSLPGINRSLDEQEQLLQSYKDILEKKSQLIEKLKKLELFSKYTNITGIIYQTTAISNNNNILLKEEDGDINLFLEETEYFETFFGDVDCFAISDCDVCTSIENCNYCTNTTFGDVGCIFASNTSMCNGCMWSDPHTCPSNGESSCDTYKSCRECSSGSPQCGWCTSTETCMSVTSNGYLCSDIECAGCVISSPLSCPTEQYKCADFTSPRNCTSNPQCGWCTSSKTCMDTTSNGYLCDSSQNCVGCLRTDPLDVPSLENSCSDFHSPRDCSSQPQCGWCTSSDTCVDVTSDGYICSPETCQGCIITDPLSAPFEYTFCANQTNCRECSTNPQCGWCTSSQTCMDTTSDGYLCEPNQCQGCLRTDPSSCPTGINTCQDFKTPRECSSNPQCAFCTSSNTCVDVTSDGYICAPETCLGCLVGDPQIAPILETFCSNQTSCRECSSNPRCGWCTSSQTCMDTTSNGYLCEPNQCQGCLRTDPLQCPAAVSSCQQYKYPRECSSQPLCGWCTSSNSCTDVTSNGYICAPEQCFGCLVTDPLQAPFGDTFCANQTSCRECSSNPRCGWCTSTNSCLDVTGNGYICDTNLDVCSGCLRTSPQQCPFSTKECVDFTECRTCSRQPNCGWCTSTGKCLETTSNGYLCQDTCSGCLRTEMKTCEQKCKPETIFAEKEDEDNDIVPITILK